MGSLLENMESTAQSVPGWLVGSSDVAARILPGSARRFTDIGARVVGLGRQRVQKLYVGAAGVDLAALGVPALATAEQADRGRPWFNVAGPCVQPCQGCKARGDFASGGMAPGHHQMRVAKSAGGLVVVQLRPGAARGDARAYWHAAGRHHG